MEGLEIEWLGEPIWLLAEKAVYRPRLRTLLVADMHLGKAATFRHAGLPIPHGTTAADLARLSKLLEITGAERLVILGDFLHAATGRAERTMDAIAFWRQSYRELAITLVRGNHDRSAGDPPNDWNIGCVDEELDAPLVYVHDPQTSPLGYAIGGHMHPNFTLWGCGPPLKSPCFWFGQHAAVLPAFGSFTGTVAAQPTAGDRIFVAGPGAVREVPVRAAKASRRR